LCRSIWFDRGELDLYRRQAGRDRLFRLERSSEFKAKRDVGVRCPNCETNTLEMGEIRGYKAGRCSGCHGVWVDPGLETPKQSERDSSVGNWMRDVADAALVAIGWFT
jgi:Zn-finger nucleic acid-binding protein